MPEKIDLLDVRANARSMSLCGSIYLLRYNAIKLKRTDRLHCAHHVAIQRYAAHTLLQFNRPHIADFCRRDISHVIAVSFDWNQNTFMSDTQDPSQPLAASARQDSLAAMLAPVTALLISVALLLMGNGLLTTLVPVRGNLENFLSYEIGILGASYFLGFTLGCYAGPSLIGRAGHIRTYLAMISVAAAIPLMQVLAIAPVPWWLLRVVTGFCFAILYIVIESWLNERSTNATRGTVFSIYLIIQFTVLSIGQMLLAVGDPKTFSLFAVVSILISLAALPVAMTSAVSPNPIPKITPKLGKLYHTSPVGFAGCLAVGLANGSFWALGPIFAQDIGFDTFGIGLFMSIAILGGAASQWPLGWLSDRRDRRYIIILAAAIAAASALGLVAFAGANQILILALAAGFGMGTFPVYAISVAHANDHAAPTDYVEVSSGLLLVFGLGASVGPLLAGFLRQNFGSLTIFFYTAAVHLILIAFVIWRMKLRNAPDDENRVEFKDAVVASETAMPLNPELKT